MNMKAIHPFLLAAVIMCGLAACGGDGLAYSPADRVLMDSIDALPHVQHTASGLRYEVVTPAEGAKPADADTIRVAYRGLHANGTPFWESAPEGEEFALNGTIQGFREGVGMMAVGSTYKLYIPSALGYGRKGYPELIQPDEPLVYEVTLKEVKKR
jgi:FKBP-type peptidyl-prolyl cis-trans isomerase